MAFFPSRTRVNGQYSVNALQVGTQSDIVLNNGDLKCVNLIADTETITTLNTTTINATTVNSTDVNSTNVTTDNLTLNNNPLIVPALVITNENANTTTRTSYERTVIISAAQLKALKASPILVMDNSDPNNRLVCLRDIIFYYRYGTIPYTIVGVHDMCFVSSAIQFGSSIPASAFMTKTIGTLYPLGTPGAFDATQASLLFQGDLYFQYVDNSGNEMLAGDGTLVINISYDILDFGSL